MQFLRKIHTNKKGSMGLNIAIGFMVAILIAGVLGIALIITMNSLDSTSVATNGTKAITANITNGVGNFFGNATTWFALLAVVVIIAIIAAVIYIVKKLGGSSDQGL